ncbi:MAG: nicotinate phosphoribosyltransferase [Alphaproteobacteria bacterium]|nr:nicotinate phosphoribosyltransferase [Alphaproteobacteria bacterium]
MLAPHDNLPIASEEIDQWTDHYFRKSRQIVTAHGDTEVTYVIFMRRPVILAPRLVMRWMENVAIDRGFSFYTLIGGEEGSWVGAGDPLLVYRGSFKELVTLETLVLQQLGATGVAAAHAYAMCCALPQTAFLAMDARHCAGTEMAVMMAYGAGVGSAAAQRDKQATGFIGNATQATAHFFGNTQAFGTAPHGLIGYAGSTLAAAHMLAQAAPDEPLSVLVDYFGQEITDALEVCRAFPDHARAGRLSVRLDTHGSRYCEGLDPTRSYEVLDRYAPESFRGYRSDVELSYLVGSGVSAAAVWHLRASLDGAGFDRVKIVASSGFTPEKCRVIGAAKTPIDVIGTGSFLPDLWNETYATADIVAYDATRRVKVGREFLHGALDRLLERSQWQRRGAL